MGACAYSFHLCGTKRCWVPWGKWSQETQALPFGQVLFPSLGLSVLSDNEGVDMLPLAPFKSNDFSSSKPPSF